MSENTIQEWLAQARAAGFSDMQIIAQLKQQGWDDTQIQQLMGSTSPLTSTASVGDQIIPSDTIPDVFALFKHAWEIYKSRIGAFVVIGLIFLVIEGLLYFVNFLIVGGTAVLGFASSATLFKGSPTAQIASAVLVAGVAVIGVTVIFGFLMAWVWSALVHAIHTYREKTDLGTILSRAFKTMIPLWWVSMLLSFFVTGATFLLFIPGIIFAVWFSNALFLPITEGARGMQALLKSKEYVRGAWWGVLGRQTVFSILVFVVFFGFSLVIGIFSSIFNNTAGQAVSAILSLIYLAVIALALPFGFCYSYALYAGLRAFKARTTVNPEQSKKVGLIVTAVAGWVVLPLVIIGIGFAIAMFVQSGLGTNDILNSNSPSMTNGLFSTNSSARTAVLDAQRKSDIAQIRMVLTLYKDDHAAYPVSLDQTASYFANKKVPVDPETGKAYTYLNYPSQSRFEVCTYNISPMWCLDSEGNTITQ